VRFNEFAKIAARNLEGNVTDDALGYARSKEIYDHLIPERLYRRRQGDFEVPAGTQSDSR